MKNLVFLLVIIPMWASAQLDFESNKYKLDFVKLPEVENLLSTSVPFQSDFSKKISAKLPSFKLDKSNYRQPVSMYEAMAASQSYVQSNIEISLDPKEYGVFGGNSSYSADGATKVTNIAYKDATRGFLITDSCPPFGICPRCAPNRINGY